MKAMPKAYSYLRFSTPEQSKGDSFRRQTEGTRTYAERHCLDLDETLTFADLGVSAFRGKNVQGGALGAFLKAIETGKIRKGSYLLVENLDRLSRDTVQRAFIQFTGILERGVNIVTLTDNKLYTAATMSENFGDLMVSLTTMFRAHEESATKSKRLSAAWKAKRDKAQVEGRKLTARCPAWLMLASDRKSFVVDIARKKVVRRIFDMTIAGHGKTVIARRFNTECVPTFGDSKGWHPSYIQKILESEAVCGVFQPMRITDNRGKRKRIPDGETIADYFPAVVDRATFEKARRSRNGRKIASGRKGSAFSNIFNSLAICGNCSAPMHYVNKGKGSKGGAYLVCSNAKRAVANCKARAWRYRETEFIVGSCLTDLKYEELAPDISAGRAAALEVLEDKKLVKESELANAVKQRVNLVDSIARLAGQRSLENRLVALETNIDHLTTELATIGAQIEDERERSSHAARDLREVQTLLASLQKTRDKHGLYDLRLRLHQMMKSAVHNIQFHPADSVLLPAFAQRNADLFGAILISFPGTDTGRIVFMLKGFKGGQVMNFKVNARRSDG